MCALVPVITDTRIFLFVFVLHVRVVVSIALRHPAVTGHNSKTNLLSASDCTAFAFPRILWRWRTKHSKAGPKPTGEFLQGNQSCLRLIPLTADSVGPTLEVSSDKKAVLIGLLSLVPAELRGKKANCVLPASWELQSWNKVTDYPEPEFHTLVYPSEKMLSSWSLPLGPQGSQLLHTGWAKVRKGWVEQREPFITMFYMLQITNGSYANINLGAYSCSYISVMNFLVRSGIKKLRLFFQTHLTD